MTEAQIAEVEEQKKPDRIWAPRVKKIHKDIHGSNGAKRRDQAQAALEAITDPEGHPVALSRVRPAAARPTSCS